MDAAGDRDRAGAAGLRFAVLAIRLTGADFKTAAGIVGNPIVTGVLILLIVTVFWHLKLGIQIVIEDYVQGHASKLFLMFANTFGCWIGGLHLRPCRPQDRLWG